MIRVRLRSLGPSGKQILLTLVVALVLVSGATAYEVPSKLNEVAHVEAGPWRRLPAVPPRPCPVDLICCARGGQSEMVPRVGSHSTERSA